MDSFFAPSSNCFNTSTTTTCLTGILGNLQTTFSNISCAVTTAGNTSSGVTYVGGSSGCFHNTWQCSSCGGLGCSACGTGNYFPQTYTWPTQPPKPNVQFQTKFDDDEKEVLEITLGSKAKCEHKVHLIPGIALYTPHKPPSKFRRFVLWLIFGVKWETTLEERFIDQL